MICMTLGKTFSETRFFHAGGQREIFVFAYSVHFFFVISFYGASKVSLAGTQ